MAKTPADMIATVSFSVIIPTLQRAPELREVVALCVQHPLVDEILIINNHEAPLEWKSPKVRVLQQNENIYVNPAWNLGAAHASSEYLAIINDDVVFDPQVFDKSAKILRTGFFGIVGPDRSSFGPQNSAKKGLRLSRETATSYGYGVFMALRKSDYTPIPGDLRIWAGDDWLIATSVRPPVSLVGYEFKTNMSTTSGSPEMQVFRAREAETAKRILGDLRPRWWKKPLHVFNRCRELRYSLRRN